MGVENSAGRDAGGHHVDARVLEASRRRVYNMMLFPALAMMFVMTIVPALYLLLTSFTPLNLAFPDTFLNFSDPLVSYKLLLEDSAR